MAQQPAHIVPSMESIDKHKPQPPKNNTNWNPIHQVNFQKKIIYIWNSHVNRCWIFFHMHNIAILLYIIMYIEIELFMPLID